MGRTVDSQIKISADASGLETFAPTVERNLGAASESAEKNAERFADAAGKYSDAATKTADALAFDSSSVDVPDSVVQTLAEARTECAALENAARDASAEVARTSETTSRTLIEESGAWERVGKARGKASDGVPKWAKELGATVDANGLLVNSLGKTVAGLSRADVEAGRWVDELGRIRTANGGFVDGLTRQQLALGMYKDELGNVCDRLGDVAIAAESAEDDGLDPLADGFDSALQAAGAAASWFSQVGTVLNSISGESTTTARVFSSLAAGVENFAQGFEAGRSILQFYRDFRAATQSATAAQVALNFVSGNWAAILGGAALAGVAVWTAWDSSADDARAATDEVSDAFLELQKRARAAGIEIKNAAGAARFGFAEALDQKTYAEELENVRQLEAEIAEQRERAAEEEARNAETLRTGGMGAGAAAANLDRSEAERLEKMTSELDAANARLVVAQESLIDAAVENARTELDKLEAQKADYQALLKQVADRDAQAIIRKQIETLESQIADAKKSEAEAATKAAEDARKAALGDLGFDSLLNAAGALNAPATAREEYDATIQKYNDALTAGTIAQEDFNRAKAAADALLLDAEKKEAEAATKVAEDAKAAARSAVGIDALLERLKTPDEIYRETMRKIDEAFELKAIDLGEKKKLQVAAKEELNAANGAGAFSGADENSFARLGESASALEKAAGKLNASTAGSASVYSMQVGAVKDYQTKALNYASRQANFAEKQTRFAEQIQYDLRSIASSSNGSPVWG